MKKREREHDKTVMIIVKLNWKKRPKVALSLSLECLSGTFKGKFRGEYNSDSQKVFIHVVQDEEDNPIPLFADCDYALKAYVAGNFLVNGQENYHEILTLKKRKTRINLKIRKGDKSLVPLK